MSKSIGLIVLNISTALYLFAVGVMGLSTKLFGFEGGEIHQAVQAIFKGNGANVCAIILSVCAIAAGVFILLRFFGVEIAITELLLLVLMIVWIVFIIMSDILPLINGKFKFVNFLRSIASHLMVLGGMALATSRFGGF